MKSSREACDSEMRLVGYLVGGNLGLLDLNLGVAPRFRSSGLSDDPHYDDEEMP